MVLGHQHLCPRVLGVLGWGYGAWQSLWSQVEGEGGLGLLCPWVWCGTESQRGTPRNSQKVRPRNSWNFPDWRSSEDLDPS